MLNFKKFKLITEGSRYMYEYVLIKVNSYDDIDMVFDYVDRTYGKKGVRDLTNVVLQFPNYLFLPTDALYSSHETYNIYKLDEHVTMDDINKYVRHNSRDINISDMIIVDELYKLKNLVNDGKTQEIVKRLNKPSADRLVYESNEKIILEGLKYNYEYILVKVNSDDDVLSIYDYIDNTFDKHGSRNVFDAIIEYPNYIFIPTYKLKIDKYESNINYHIYRLNTNTSLEELEEYQNDQPGQINTDMILTIDELYKIPNLLNSDNFLNKYSKPNVNRLVYESNKNNILYAFDMDDTLVFNNKYEDEVKNLLLEYLTPSEIFKKKIKEVGIDISRLKYEDGRIFFNDPKKEFDIFSSDWVRKKDRVYLTQPDEYLLTDESLPISINDVMVDLYESVENKCIISARTEKSKTKILKRLQKLGITTPNYGLFMLNEKYSNKVKFKCDILIDLYNNVKFNEIHYFDDNIKLLKKMREYLKDYDINISLYKVGKTEYRKIW